MLVLLLIATLLIPSFAFAKDNVKIAKVIESSGDVQVKKGGGEKKFNVFKNMGLTQGDTIITGRNGKTTIELDKDKEVAIGPDTQLVISELVSSIKAESGKTSLNLLGGKVMVNVKEKLKGDSKFEIKTPTSVMGVRGTNFYVGVNPVTGGTYLAVFSGVVEAGNLNNRPGAGGTSFVYPSQQISFDGSSIDESQIPEPLDLENLDSFGLEELSDGIEQYPDQLQAELIRELERIRALAEQKRQEEEKRRLQQEQQLLELLKARQGRVNHTPPAPPAPPVLPVENEPEDPYVPPVNPDPQLPSIKLIGIKDIEIPYGGEGRFTLSVNPNDSRLIASYPGDQQGLIELHHGSVDGEYEIRINQPYEDIEVTLKADKDGYTETIEKFNVIVDYSGGPYIEGPFSAKYYLDTYVDMDFKLNLNGDALVGIVNNSYSESEASYELVKDQYQSDYYLEGNKLTISSNYFESSFYDNKTEANLELQFASGKHLLLTIYFIEKPSLTLVDAYIQEDQKTVDFVFDHEVYNVRNNIEWSLYYSQKDDIFFPVYATNSIKSVTLDGNIFRITFQEPFQGDQNRFLFENDVFDAVIVTEPLQANGSAENFNINNNRMMEGLYFILPADVDVISGNPTHPALFYKACDGIDNCGYLTPLEINYTYNVTPEFVLISIGRNDLELFGAITELHAQYSTKQERQLIFTIHDNSMYYTPLEIVDTVVNAVYDEVTFIFNQPVYFDYNYGSLRGAIRLSRDGFTNVPLGDYDDGQFGSDQRSLTITLSTPLIGNHNQFIIETWSFFDEYYNWFKEDVVSDVIVSDLDPASLDDAEELLPHYYYSGFYLSIWLFSGSFGLEKISYKVWDDASGDYGVENQLEQQSNYTADDWSVYIQSDALSSMFSNELTSKVKLVFQFSNREDVEAIIFR